ncbi:hypothetical protein [Streptomyces hebeiensis]
MREQATDTRTHDPEEVTATIQAGHFWRLVPEWAPRDFGEPTRELALRVERGLRAWAS